MTELGGQEDVNEAAWDPARDSSNERRSLLRNLDPAAVENVLELLDPAQRTVDGQPLGLRARSLLLGCSVEDLEVLTNEINARAEIDDHEEEAELHLAWEELEGLLGRHRLLKRDSDERTISRMPIGERRRARELLLAIEAYQRKRYDPLVLRRRDLEADQRLLPVAVRLAEQRDDAPDLRYLRRRLKETADQLAVLEAGSVQEDADARRVGDAAAP